jgi:hypothetical protein
LHVFDYSGDGAAHKSLDKSIDCAEFISVVYSVVL